MSAEAAIETRALTCVFRQLWRRREVRALDGVSLVVKRGTSFGLLGPNGAGKTTFVKLLLGITRATSGEARLFGLDCRRPEARQPVGYLPENHRLPSYWTGAGLLEFSAALSGVDSATRRRKAIELLELVGLSDWGGVRISRYSKGMLQRLGLAQAMMHSPQLLILDEPTDGVDPIGRRQIRSILRQLEERGVTIFLNSHLLTEVELACQEVAILDRGRVVLAGKVRELIRDGGYRLTALGVPEQLFERLRTWASAAALRDGAAELRFATREQLNEAVDLLRAERCLVESIVPMSSTLEQVFMRAVGSEDTCG